MIFENLSIRTAELNVADTMTKFTDFQLFLLIILSQANLRKHTITFMRVDKKIILKNTFNFERFIFADVLGII